MITAENNAYLVWSADSPVVQVPVSTDSFEIKEGKIIWQSLAAYIVQK